MAEQSQSEAVEYGKDCRIKTPLNQFQIAITLCQVEQMAVVPGLEMTFVHGFDAPAEKTGESMEVWNRDDHRFAGDFGEDSDGFYRRWNMFEDMITNHRIKRFLAELGQWVLGVEQNCISLLRTDSHAFFVRVSPYNLVPLSP